MRNLDHLKKHLVSGGQGVADGGAWQFGDMRVIASWGEGWDHVSVSLRNRCPEWSEMEHVRRLFFKDNETVMQLHVPPEDHVNCHPFCLHMWRPQNAEIPRPPAWMVGPTNAVKRATEDA